MIIAVAIALLASPIAHSDIEETRTTLRTHVLKLINSDRQLYGLPPVELDLAVSAIADDYCDAQIRNRTTGHFTVDGLTPYMRYSFAGGNDGISENAAAWSANYVFNDRALYEMARRSQDAMMAEVAPDDGHKRTILDPHATHVGIGVAWERGEFRLAHEFVRRYIDWTRPLPRNGRAGEPVMGSGRPMAGAVIEGITVHHEALPQRMPAHVASAMASYSLPNRRREYLPRLHSSYNRRPDGTIEMIRREYSDGSRGDFHVAKDGSFSFAVPLHEGAGIYTVVVWVTRPGFDTPFAASNVSIRVESGTQGHSRASAAGR